MVGQCRDQSKHLESQGDQKVGKNIRPNFEKKVAQTVVKTKNAKISLSKLKLKVKNIYI
jgi:hypothetical protein